MKLRSFGGIVSHLFFPHCCPLCGEVGVFVCDDCLSSVLSGPAPLPRCLECGAPLPCARHGTRYQLRSRVAHRGKARELLLAAKYGGAGRLSLRLGEELAPLVSESAGWVLTTVPEHAQFALLPRGDRHLTWMARGLARRLGVPLLDLLKWRRGVRPQKEQPNAEARRQLPHDCFVPVRKPPGRVIVLDDVCTTGTTLARAASCLYGAGAFEVLCLSWSAAVR